MPELLSIILKNSDWKDSEWLVEFNPECVKEKPELAALIAEAIARWSMIECALNRVLISVLGAHTRPAAAMFSALRTLRTRLDALLAAGESILTSDDLESFKAAVEISRNQGKTRLKLAHWIWGHSPQIPGALLLANPDALSDHFIKMAKHQAEFAAGDSFNIPLDQIGTHFMFDLERIYVYRKSDLEIINRDFKETGEILGLLAFVLDPPPFGRSRERSLRQLSTLGLYRKAIDRMREGRKNILPTPP